MEERRKWEDLEMDCLVNVFARVGIESLLLHVPFVCKSWHRATLNPLCWKCLDFPFACDPSFKNSILHRFKDLYGIKDLSTTAFIKFIVDRSCRIATTLVLSICCTEEALKYVADGCPALKILAFPNHLLHDYLHIIPELMKKLKNLECLQVDGTSTILGAIIPEIGLNCKHFRELHAPGVHIGHEEASAIVTSLPSIKYLDFYGGTIDRKSLVIILQGCKELVYLDVSDCQGFEADEEILELASHIVTFKYDDSYIVEMDTDDDSGEWSVCL